MPSRVQNSRFHFDLSIIILEESNIIFTNEIALGLSRYLSVFKKVVPKAHDYADLGLNPYTNDFATKPLQIMQEADKIHFNLSNMRGLMGPQGVLTGPKELNSVGSTNWELRTIWDDTKLLAKTIFYRDGKVISTEDILKLM